MNRMLAIVLFCHSLVVSSQPKNDMKLWYTSPAGSTWENALPIGNGRLAAMVFGNVERETIQLNEHTVWSGSPHRNDNRAALSALPELRQLIWEGKQKEAEKLADQVIISKGSQGQKFQPVGNLFLTFPDHDQYANYSRELDLEQALSSTTYTVGDVTYTREVLSSFDNDVIVVHLKANKKESISFDAAFSTPHKNRQVTTTPENELVISATTSDHEGVEGKIKFTVIVRIRPEGGSISSSDSTVMVSKANSATIFISVATNFNSYNDLSGDENERAKTYLNNAYRKTFDEIKKTHVAVFEKYFDRVKLDLGATEAMNFPTDVRLKNFRSANDPHLVTLYFQYGRYLLISSSRPGGQPANLQGIWNDNMDPPWDSKYTININAEMNYWPAEKTNLPELHEPFLKMVKELSETGRVTAKTMYGARGWTAHHNTDIWRVTGAIDGAFWGAWNAGGGWTSQHLWEHYLYSGDTNYLRSVYPLLKGAAAFYVDFLVEHPTYKWLVVNPDMSPENAPKAHQGSSLDAGTTMTNQIVFDVFSTSIRAAETLNADKTFVDTLRQLRSRLAPMHIGRYNQLQEWLDDIDDPDDHHRHISHLYGLFPSNQISPYLTPQLFAAAKNTLNQRGDVSTGWSMGWKVNWWARMLDGNRAYKIIQNQLSPVSGKAEGGGSYNNLFDAHPPFQIDGNFGCTSGIAEMLVQGASDAVQLLPALPDVWSSGTVSGLRAKGGFEITDMQWEKSKLVRAVIKSNLGGNLRLRLPNLMTLKDGGELIKAVGGNTNPFYQIERVPAPIISPASSISSPELKETVVYDLPTRPGKFYTLISQ